MGLALRLAGAALIVLAASRLGALVAGRFTARRLDLRSLTDALERLETEVVYGATPLPRALGELAESGPSRVRAFFADVVSRLGVADDLPMAWREALDAFFATSSLIGSDRGALRPLGDVLGRSDRQDQSRHLKATAQKLRQLEAQAALDEDRHARLWRSVGTLGGLAIAIIFL